MVYHTRSKGAPPSLPSENRKGKKKVTNDKVMVRAIEKQHPSNKLVPSLEQKIKELEKEISDMHEWAKLLLSANPTLETNIDKQPVTSQATFQNDPPPNHPTPHPQNQLSSIHMPPENTQFPNYQYPPQHHAYAARPPYLTPCMHNPTMQAPRYESPLHQISWFRAPLILFQIPPYQMPPSQKPPLPYQQPAYLVHNVKTLTQPHIRRNLFNVQKKPIKIYASLAEPFDQLYKRLNMAGCVTFILAKISDTQSKGYDPNEICDYHSGMKEHTTETCRDLRDKIQQLIKAKVIYWTDLVPKDPQQ
ncbi:hypothetical protein KY290_007846 [Solanum tuberosum]|uniref:Uncharacterized protein n=1 Tax=Solanum tuberosum TaxID=4113 RepID=A0ABQ7W764_SOLTU|nr:hypothetical protein KY290_007846 [Solanum tuberosum]